MSLDLFFSVLLHRRHRHAEPPTKSDSMAISMPPSVPTACAMEGISCWLIKVSHIGIRNYWISRLNKTDRGDRGSRAVDKV